MFSHGMTETEARDSFESLVPEQAEYMKECTNVQENILIGTTRT